MVVVEVKLDSKDEVRFCNSWMWYLCDAVGIVLQWSIFWASYIVSFWYT